MTSDQTDTPQILDERHLAQLETELSQAHARIEQLQKEWRKYRRALNSICHPTSWGVIPGHEVEIARRALIIGGNEDLIPKEARKILDNES